MATTYKTPGVYIEELPTTGPIAGVGTSTAAFIGPALRGPIKIPTKVTNWTQFKEAFGEYILLGSTRYHMAHAVRGFFDNGGTVAYIVRVATANRAFWEFDDQGGTGKALRVEAKEEGTGGNTITALPQSAQIVTAAKVRKVDAEFDSASGNIVTMKTEADALKFAPGDWVTVYSVTGTTTTPTAERAQIDRIRAKEIVLASNLTANYPAVAGTTRFLRIADLKGTLNQRTFRVQNRAGIEPGSVLNVKQIIATTTTQEDVVVSAVAGEFVTVESLTRDYRLAVTDPDVTITSYEFTLVITKAPATPETFEKLSMDPRHSRYFARIVTSAWVTAALPASPTTALPPGNRPVFPVPPTPTSLAGGTADRIDQLVDLDYEDALETLQRVDDVNLICVPDRSGSVNFQQKLVAHCEKMGDRFAILDSGLGDLPLGSGLGTVIRHRQSVESTRGYAALYYPWIRINDPTSPTGEDTILVPPSGHLAGIFARSDNQRGVHKAPANETIAGAVDLERGLSNEDQGELNMENVNGLRMFAGRARPVVWGARTTAALDETVWRYVNVRRLFLYVEESIKEGIRRAVFEPNDLTLWKKLHRTITEFLTRVWRSGALFGATPGQAFYVKIDEELNPPSVRALGQVIIEIGMAAVRPAEFVIVRIGMWDGGASVTEA